MEEKRLKKSIIYLFCIALMCNIAFGASVVDAKNKDKKIQTVKKEAVLKKQPVAKKAAVAPKATVAKKATVAPKATVAKKATVAPKATVAKKATKENLMFKSSLELEGETLSGLSESIKKDNEKKEVLYGEEIQVTKVAETKVKKQSIEKNDKNIEKNKIEVTTEMDSVFVVVPNGQPVHGEAKYTSKFGNRRLSAKKTRFHWGIDYGASIGTEILSTANGVVEFVGNRGAYGKVVIVSHGYGFKTLYAHLSSIEVISGQTVNKKQVIAKSGNTGRSTGPHLHYEVHYLNERLDPQNFSEWNTGNYAALFKKLPKIQWDVLVGQIKRDSVVVNNDKVKNKKKDDSLVVKNNKREISVRTSKES